MPLNRIIFNIVNTKISQVSFFFSSTAHPKVQANSHFNHYTYTKLIVYREGDIVKQPKKKAPLCPKMYQGWGGEGWGGVGWVLKGWGGWVMKGWGGVG